jgi:hypothetical protein
MCNAFDAGTKKVIRKEQVKCFYELWIYPTIRNLTNPCHFCGLSQAKDSFLVHFSWHTKAQNFQVRILQPQTLPKQSGQDGRPVSKITDFGVIWSNQTSLQSQYKSVCPWQSQHICCGQCKLPQYHDEFPVLQSLSTSSPLQNLDSLDLQHLKQQIFHWKLLPQYKSASSTSRYLAIALFSRVQTFLRIHTKGFSIL